MTESFCWILNLRMPSDPRRVSSAWTVRHWLRGDSPHYGEVRVVGKRHKVCARWSFARRVGSCSSRKVAGERSDHAFSSSAPGSAKPPVALLCSTVDRELLFRNVFRVAAVYNIVWGTVVVLFPNLVFEIFGLPSINYPFV